MDSFLRKQPHILQARSVQTDFVHQRSFPGSSFDIFICARGAFDTVFSLGLVLQGSLDHFSDSRALSRFKLFMAHICTTSKA